MKGDNPKTAAFPCSECLEDGLMECRGHALEPNENSGRGYTPRQIDDTFVETHRSIHFRLSRGFALLRQKGDW